MRYTVVGAGAIGGTIGAYMQRAGESVQFVDAAADHVGRMQAAGLTIRGFDQTFTVQPVRAMLPGELDGPLEVVLLAVKAQDTRVAIESLLPWLTDASCVVSLQNGLCERTISELVGSDRTIGCFVNFSADYLEPGLIHYGGPGAFYLGELDGRQSDRVQRIAAAIGKWGPVRITDNIWGYLWGKLGYANMLFATAIVDADMADVIERYPELMVELAAEVYEVAALEGVKPEPFDAVEPSLYYPRAARDSDATSQAIEHLVKLRRADQKTRSGIWRDLAVRRRRTEVDQQIGLVAEIGVRHGLPMPLTSKLVQTIHHLERGCRERDWANVEELERLRQEIWV